MPQHQVILPLPNPDPLVRTSACQDCQQTLIWGLLQWAVQLAFWWVKRTITAILVLEYVIKFLLHAAQGHSTKICLANAALPLWPDKRVVVGVDPRTGRPVRKRTGRPEHQPPTDLVTGGGGFGGGGAGGTWESVNPWDALIVYNPTGRAGAPGEPMTDEQIAFADELAVWQMAEGSGPGVLTTDGIQAGKPNGDMSAPLPNDRMKRYWRGNSLPFSSRRIR